MNNKSKIVTILFFWLLITFVFVLCNEKVFIFGQTIGLKVHPVDPSDLLRGQYVRLEYDISKIPAKVSLIRGRNNIKSGDDIYVILKAVPGGIYEVKSISRTKPKTGELFIAGKVYHIFYHSKYGKDYADLSIKYGIENFFTKQDEAKRLERELIKNGGTATVVLDKEGRAKVIGVK